MGASAGEPGGLRTLRQRQEFFLEALGQAVVETGRRVVWFTLEHLGGPVAAHRADHTVTQAAARILRADLVAAGGQNLLAVDAGPYHAC